MLLFDLLMKAIAFQPLDTLFELADILLFRCQRAGRRKRSPASRGEKLPFRSASSCLTQRRNAVGPRLDALHACLTV